MLFSAHILTLTLTLNTNPNRHPNHNHNPLTENSLVQLSICVDGKYYLQFRIIGTLGLWHRGR